MFGKFPDAVEKVKAFFSPLQSLISFFDKAYMAASNLGGYLKDTLLTAMEAIGGIFGSTKPLVMESNSTMQSVGGQSGLLGSAATSINSQSATSSDNSTKIQELNITVNSPNSADAGRNVVSELERRGMIMTRNSQSQVLK